jgi:hypothetical protein
VEKREGVSGLPCSLSLRANGRGSLGRCASRTFEGDCLISFKSTPRPVQNQHATYTQGASSVKFVFRSSAWLLGCFRLGRSSLRNKQADVILDSDRAPRKSLINVPTLPHYCDLLGGRRLLSFATIRPLFSAHVPFRILVVT